LWQRVPWSERRWWRVDDGGEGGGPTVTTAGAPAPHCRGCRSS
jgi:hypothetical protein